MKLLIGCVMAGMLALTGCQNMPLQHQGAKVKGGQTTLDQPVRLTMADGSKVDVITVGRQEKIGNHTYLNVGTTSGALQLRIEHIAIVEGGDLKSLLARQSQGRGGYGSDERGGGGRDQRGPQGQRGGPQGRGGWEDERGGGRGGFGGRGGMGGWGGAFGGPGGGRGMGPGGPGGGPGMGQREMGPRGGRGEARRPATQKAPEKKEAETKKAETKAATAPKTER